MNLEEEVFLSAYLDGELDPEQHAQVASALVSDARLSEHFRQLVAVRDALSSLPRPTLNVDLASSILAQIDSKPRFGVFARAVAFKNASPSTRVAALVSLAAILVLALTIGLQWSAHRVDSVQTAANSAIRNRETNPNSQPAASDLASAPSSDLPSASHSPISVSSGIDSKTDLQERDKEHVRDLLFSPRLRKVFLITDVLGSDAPVRVGDILDKTPRHHASYGRITVSQQIVIDPDHPGRATVFAVVMDEGEIRQLGSKLKDVFHESVKETDPRPETVVQLADIGQVRVFPGTPVAELIPPAELARALRNDPPKTSPESKVVIHDPDSPDEPLVSIVDRHIDDAVSPGVKPSQRTGPTPEQERSGPHPSLRDRTERATADSSGSARPLSHPSTLDQRIPPRSSVVLVWVTSSKSREPALR